MSAGALYLHVPFCKRKCSYCDFTSFATRSDDPLMAAYVHALSEQVREAAELGLTDGVRTAYIGGGTPTHAGKPVEELARTISSIHTLDEFTMEANPESCTLDLLSTCKDGGVSRISMGVQSLDDDELAALGRVHDARTAVTALATAAELGFDVSADLMCAIPLQTAASFRGTLQRVHETGVGHVSVYPLMIEEGTAFARAVEAGEQEAPDDADEAARMEEADALLAGFGFERYEVASYALRGHSCRHNRAYWTGVPYLGLGTGAASMFERDGFPALFAAFPQLDVPPRDAYRARLACTSDRAHLAARPRLIDLSFEVEYLTLRQALAEDLMLGARMSCGLSRELVARARTVMGAALDDCLASLIADGYLTDDLAPTHAGWLMGNRLFGRLWDLA